MSASVRSIADRARLRWVRSNVRPVVQILYWLLAIAVAGTMAVSLVLMAQGYRVAAVTSGSMSPAYDVGDAVIIESVAAEDVHVGDAIVFTNRDSAALTIHRVVDVLFVEGKMSFRTKGDANNSTDPDLVKPEGVQSRAVYGIPFLGWVLAALSAKIAVGILTLVLLVTIYREVLVIVRIRRRRAVRTLAP